jgi:hypothetical protein
MRFSDSILYPIESCIGFLYLLLCLGLDFFAADLAPITVSIRTRLALRLEVLSFDDEITSLSEMFLFLIKNIGI